MTSIKFDHKIIGEDVEITTTFDDVVRTYTFPITEVPGPKQMFYSGLDKLREEFGETMIPRPSVVDAPDTW